MGALWLEAVLVGDVVDGVGLSVLGVDPAEGTAHAQHGVLVAAGFDMGGLLAERTVGQLVGEVVAVQANVVRWELLHQHRLLRSGQSHGYQSEENYGLEDDGVLGEYFVLGVVLRLRLKMEIMVEPRFFCL